MKFIGTNHVKVWKGQTIKRPAAIRCHILILNYLLYFIKYFAVFKCWISAPDLLRGTTIAGDYLIAPEDLVSRLITEIIYYAL